MAYLHDDMNWSGKFMHKIVDNLFVFEIMMCHEQYIYIYMNWI